jgi:signal transduction histidine kinase
MTFAWFRRWFGWTTHPITVFVSLQVLLVSFITIWVIWFVDLQNELRKFASAFGQRYFFDNRFALVILVIGCILLGMALVGTTVLFVQSRRQNRLLKLQRNFISSVSHELRSPLASIKLAMETMDKHQLDQAAHKRLSTMMKSDIDRLNRLVEQVLVSARFDRGVRVFSDKSDHLSLKKLLYSLIESVSYLDEHIAQRLQIDFADSIELHASRSGLMLIFVNLLENAIKYSPKGSPIHIGVENHPESALVSVKVTDQGIGIEERDLRRVFRMFYRSNVATEKAIPGTGLGLFIVKSTVLLMGGRVRIDSPGKNQGTVVTVELPYS